MKKVGAGSLVDTELFSELPVDEIGELAKRCVWRRYDKDEQVVDRSSESRDVFLVVEGRVVVVNYSSTGREISFANVRPGGYFGELSAIDGEPRSATVNVAEDCLLAAISPRLFKDILSRYPTVAEHVMRRLARIIRICDERIMDLSTLGAVQRVYLELLRLAKEEDIAAATWVIYPMPTQAQIASRASTTRETVARVIGQLAQEDLVARKGRSLYLRDRDTLAARAERMTPHQDVVA